MITRKKRPHNTLFENSNYRKNSLHFVTITLSKALRDQHPQRGERHREDHRRDHVRDRELLHFHDRKAGRQEHKSAHRLKVRDHALVGQREDQLCREKQDQKHDELRDPDKHQRFFQLAREDHRGKEIQYGF